ncbi:MAG TPA: sigma-70 family RNA polymerase sigma factor [Bryobacteraceae bacterium]|nr:sigma-70 family RNA polymerase sigma factor [Bryobacteraceae bacterium]
MLSLTTEPGGQRAEQNRRISEVIQRERRRLLNFIRKRVDDAGDAEDILQDVFFELVEAYRFMKPVEQAGAWLYRVARNRIVDRFRRKKLEARAEPPSEANPGDQPLMLEELLPSPDAGPEALYARNVLLEELDAALDELPEEQRDVFIAHELDGRSFKQLAEETGVSVNTLLSRKHYAIVHLRRRLRAIYDEITSL